MLIYLFVVLFCVALIITLVGSYLSPHPHTRTQRHVAYAPRTRRGLSQGNRPRSRYSRRGDPSWSPVLPDNDSTPAYGRPQRSRRSQGSGHIFSQISTLESPHEWVVNPRSTRFPHWLKLTLLSGTIFTLCLLLFMQVMNGDRIALIFDSLDPQKKDANTALYAENLGGSNASKSIVRIAQLDQNQYNSPNEYNQWSPSACSTATITEIINAYGHNYRISDILKVEVDQHAISPELGLLEARGIDRTVTQFGFKMVPFQHSTLDDAIAVANQGHPVIISFANSGYWPGGHILILRGGDAQNVNLADSSRLNLTVVSRNQFSQWWTGFMVLPIPRED